MSKINLSGWATRFTSCIFPLVLLSGCAVPAKYDYSNFMASRPASILVLPPLNNTPEIKATPSTLVNSVYPLSEAGFYVVPVTLMNEAFETNGVHNAAEAHEIPREKLYEIFGSDAILYVKVTDYGRRYLVLTSVTTVTASARLIDSKTGLLLWEGSATASDDEGGSSGGLAAMLITAVVKQIVGSVVDNSHTVGSVTAARLLYPDNIRGMLYGPRHSSYQKSK